MLHASQKQVLRAFGAQDDKRGRSRGEKRERVQRSGTNASPLFAFIGMTNWFAPAS